MRTESIPVIDIDSLQDPRTLGALDMACREWGFFQVTNHGIDDGVTKGLFNAMHDFFALPDSAKQAISRTAENPWGFFDRELTKNIQDWKQIYDYGPGDGERMQPQWPQEVPDFPEAIESFYQRSEELSFRLLAAISTNLGMSQDSLAASFRPEHSSFLRLNYYPVCPTPERPDGLAAPGEGHLGINHHTDAGALTVLLPDDQPGLEVFKDGAWHLVRQRPDALIINIGDIVQVWSNDSYHAALHRVVASSDIPRFSAPFFFNPAYRANYEPLPSTITADHPAHYRAINWGEFRAQRAAGDYADYGDEVQISHYQI